MFVSGYQEKRFVTVVNIYSLVALVSYVKELSAGGVLLSVL